VKESTKSKNKSEMLLTHTLNKNWKKDFQNYQEVSVSLKLEVLLKSRSDRSKIESKMLSVLLKQLLKKVSLLEEDVLFSMPARLLKP
jgi:hypothetical protein